MSLTIELTEPEVTLLQQLLQGDKARLGVEIAHTDRRALKEELKLREELLDGVISRVAGRSS